MVNERRVRSSGLSGRVLVVVIVLTAASAAFFGAKYTKWKDVKSESATQPAD